MELGEAPVGGAIAISSRCHGVGGEILHLSPNGEVDLWLTRLTNDISSKLPSRNVPVDLLTFHSSKLLFHLPSHGALGPRDRLSLFFI